MGETPPAAPPSRVRQMNTGGGGEIVEVQGGHIVRSTGRKDRHSKVCTAKGPRDRRVRLAAHTAIQFYDVQDRLGYDRPSKAVDWLIKKAKSSIDELAQLPPWHPTNTTPPSSSAPSFQQEEDRRQHQQQHHDDLMINSISGPSGNNPNTHSSSFLPPSLDSDAIADTIKSFFPMGASADASSSAMQFHNSQDLRLSLQSFAQDPILLHHHNTEQTHQQQHIHGQVLLSGIPLGFDGTGGWAAEHHHHQQAADLSRFHRHAASWNSGGSDGAAAGYLFSSNSPQLQQLLGENQNQNQFISQRGPLQSSNTPAIRAWMDPSTADHGGQQQYHHLLPIYPPSISATGFSSGGGGFSGFHIPARFQGDQEEHDGYPDKPSSASSDSRH